MSLLQWWRGSCLNSINIILVRCLLQALCEKNHEPCTLVIKQISTSVCLLSYLAVRGLTTEIIKQYFALERPESMGLTFAVKNNAKQMNTARIFQSASVWNLMPSFGKKIMKLCNSLGIFSFVLLSLFTYEHYVNLSQRICIMVIVINNNNNRNSI